MGSSVEAPKDLMTIKMLNSTTLLYSPQMPQPSSLSCQFGGLATPGGIAVNPPSGAKAWSLARVDMPQLRSFSLSPFNVERSPVTFDKMGTSTLGRSVILRIIQLCISALPPSLFSPDESCFHATLLVDPPEHAFRSSPSRLDRGKPALLLTRNRVL